MTPDNVYIIPERPQRNAVMPALATIEVFPVEGKWKPELDFLHVGDTFEDDEGRMWSVTSSCQVQDSSRDPDAHGYTMTYFWRYEVQEIR